MALNLPPLAAVSVTGQAVLPPATQLAQSVCKATCTSARQWVTPARAAACAHTLGSDRLTPLHWAVGQACVQADGQWCYLEFKHALYWQRVTPEQVASSPMYLDPKKKRKRVICSSCYRDLAAFDLRMISALNGTSVAPEAGPAARPCFLDAKAVDLIQKRCKWGEWAPGGSKYVKKPVTVWSVVAIVVVVLLLALSCYQYGKSMWETAKEVVAWVRGKR
ncbi:hypothetical protein GGF32_006904 [Allomyces javanicus]|nr:hypothetical protein GGF32_006904 [Allomyces javanicus]